MELADFGRTTPEAAWQCDRRMETLGRLMVAIAHDLNNALTPVFIAAGTLRAADLVRQVLAFASARNDQRKVLDLAQMFVNASREPAQRPACQEKCALASGWRCA